MIVSFLNLYLLKTYNIGKLILTNHCSLKYHILDLGIIIVAQFVVNVEKLLSPNQIKLLQNTDR